jgi:hypothetical protein
MILRDEIRDLLELFGLFDGCNVVSQHIALASVLLHDCLGECGLQSFYNFGDIDYADSLGTWVIDDLNLYCLIGSVNCINMVDVNGTLVTLLDGYDFGGIESFSCVNIDNFDELLGDLGDRGDFRSGDGSGDDWLGLDDAHDWNGVRVDLDDLFGVSRHVFVEDVARLLLIPSDDGDSGCLTFRSHNE